MKQIPLTQGQFALVDDEDFERFNEFKWFAHKHRCTFYAQRRIPFPSLKSKQYNISMHRQIMPCCAPLQCDHIDGNGLNNQKSNLRIVTVRQNNQNRHNKRTSSYPGVYKVSGNTQSTKNPWGSVVCWGGKNRHFGRFPTEKLAHERYLLVCKNIESIERGFVVEPNYTYIDPVSALYPQPAGVQ